MQRCALLAQCSDSPSGLTRLFCSDAMRDAHVRLAEWMTSAGLQTRLDAAGNLIGRRQSSIQPARTILVGSHVDTVVNAGWYDGALGVLMGLALAELLQEEQAELPTSLDVIAFSEEEGVRFQTPYIGSRAVAGDLQSDDPLLKRLDSAGVRMHDALAGFGCDPSELDAAAYDPPQVVAFIEPHIEQGPVLERYDAPVAVVTGVAGQTRACFRFIGVSGHAGTVPMNMRRDPLPAAASLVCQINELATAQTGMVATVGQLQVQPNVGNVIPSEVAVRLDLRHLDDQQREACFEAIHQHAVAVAGEHNVDCLLEWRQEQPATRCDGRCMAVLEQSMTAENLTPHLLASGAGHDAVVMAQKFATALLFVRCRGGVSHHPDESVEPADVQAGLRVLWRSINKLAENQRQPQQVVGVS